MKLAIIHDELLYEESRFSQAISSRTAAVKNELKLKEIIGKINKALVTPLNIHKHYNYLRNRNVDASKRIDEKSIGEKLLKLLNNMFASKANVLSGNFQKDRASELFNFKPNGKVLASIAPNVNIQALYDQIQPELRQYAQELKQSSYKQTRDQAAKAAARAPERAARRNDLIYLMRKYGIDAQKAASILKDKRNTNTRTSRPVDRNAVNDALGLRAEEIIRDDFVLTEAGIFGALFNPERSQMGKTSLSVNDIPWLEAYYYNIMLNRRMLEKAIDIYSRDMTDKFMPDKIFHGTPTEPQNELISIQWPKNPYETMKLLYKLLTGEKVSPSTKEKYKWQDILNVTPQNAKSTLKKIFDDGITFSELDDTAKAKLDDNRRDTLTAYLRRYKEYRNLLGNGFNEFYAQLSAD